MINKNFHDDDIKVQILKPPFFEPTGNVIPRQEAWKKGLWYSTVNLWVVQSGKVPSIIYQQRSPDIGWAPGKLDVLIAGHCEDLHTAIETLSIEAKEELNISYDQSEYISLGRKLSVGVGQDGSIRNSVVSLYLIEDNLPINRFLMEKKEVYAVCACPISELIKVHQDKNYSFNQIIYKHDGTQSELTINQNIFPPNWDPYHYKMTMLIDKYFKGDRNLYY